jgi:anaerobic selenocysteine-containing dehydrogenase
MRGLQNPERLNGAGRLLHPLERRNGALEKVSSASAMRDIAEQLSDIVSRYGPRSVGIFIGTQGWLGSTTTGTAAAAFASALGTPSLFGTMTIDQSAKWVAQERIGVYNGGPQLFEHSDVWMLVGANSLLSLAGGPGLAGFSTTNPMKSLRDAKQRGMKLIVIDPRFTETARHADLFLQPRPGEDAALLAGIIHVVLREGWHDAKFCASFVNGVDDIRRSLTRFTPEVVGERTGLAPEEIVAAARLFAHERRRGMVGTGTGPNMGPHSNVAEHLAQTLNVICGRYVAEGEPVRNPGVLQPFAGRFADVTAPTRCWEEGPKSRRLNLGRINGEMMTGELASEMLLPGPGRIRALICVGSNPAVSLPDQAQALAALKSLDMLVTLDPRLSATAKLAHFVIPPLLSFERHDCTAFLESQFQMPYAHYAEPVIDPPSGSDLLEEWEFFWELSHRMSLRYELGGFRADIDPRPTTEELLSALTATARVPLAQVRAQRGGAIHSADDLVVQPGRPGMSARLDLAPQDVIEEIEAISLAPHRDEPGTFLLTVRRLKEFNNSTLTDAVKSRERMPHNPAYLHPDDVSDLGLVDDELVLISSATGEISATVRSDPTLRRGIVSVAHCWGKEDREGISEATSRLVSSEQNLQTINGMPQMTAIPVRISRIAGASHVAA